jgi:hypothetical protein
MEKLLAVVGALSLLAACGPAAHEEVEVATGAIIGGTPVASAAAGGNVYLVRTSGVTGAGSGVLLTNEWVMTAAHVVYDVRDTPSSLLVTMGNQTIAGKEIHIHPLYAPKLKPEDLQPDDIDVALVKVDHPFTGPASKPTYARKITARATPDLIDTLNLKTRCIGYGPTTLTNRQVGSLSGLQVSPPALTQADFDMENFPEFRLNANRWNTGFVTPRNSQGQVTYPGDSGAGCFATSPAGDEELYGVHIAGVQLPCASDSACTAGAGDKCVKPTGQTHGTCAIYSPAVGIEASAQAFRGFARAVMRTGTSTGSLSGAGTTDRVTLRLDVLGQYVLDFEFQGLPLLTLPTFVYDTFGLKAMAQMELADFDGDGLGDMVLLVEGQNILTGTTGRFGLLISSRKISEGWVALIDDSSNSTAGLFQQFGFDFGTGVSHFDLADTDGDQYADLVAVRESGTVTVYRGGVNGLAQDLPPRGFDFDGDGIEDVLVASRGLSASGDADFRFNIGFGGTRRRVTVRQQDLSGTSEFQSFGFFGYGDFDGSCRPGAAGPCDDEIIVGAPRKDVAGVTDAGSLFYVKFDGAQRELNRSNLAAPPTGIGLGEGFAVGDFNGDGFDDVAAAVLTLGEAPSSIFVLYGGEGGLSASSPSETLQPTDFGLTGDPADWFGVGLTAGDFNCDGIEDLAVGAPRMAVGAAADAGAVIVVYGRAGKLRGAPWARFDKTTAGVPGDPATADEFGLHLAAGNFNGDVSGGNACVDLAVGAAGDGGSGAVYVLRGGTSGLTGSGAQRLAQGDHGIAGTPESGDLFGWSLAITRANNDAFDDLLVGAPDDQGMTGTVHVLLGGPDGIASSGHAVLRQGTSPLPFGLNPDRADVQSEFGLSVGGTSDGVVAVGAPHEAQAALGTTDPLFRATGLLALVQYGRSSALSVDEFTTDLGDVVPAVGQLTQETFTVKRADQSWSQFLDTGYFDEPFDTLFQVGTFGDIVSGARPGRVGAPVRRRSNLGGDFQRSNVVNESGRLASKPPVAPRLTGPCVLTASGIEVRDRGHLLARDLFAGGSFSLGADGAITAKVTARGNGALGPRSTVFGDVTLAGALRPDAGAAIKGTLIEHAPVAPLPLPTQVFTAGTRALTVANDAALAVEPGSYGDGMVRARGVAVLGAGTYTFSSLRMEDARLVLDTSHGAILINVVGALDFGDRAVVEARDPRLVRFYSNTGGTIRIGNDARFGGILAAPAASVQLASRSRVSSCIASREVVLEPDASLNGL